MPRHWLKRPTYEHTTGPTVRAAPCHDDHGVVDHDYIHSFFEDAPRDCLFVVLAVVSLLLKKMGHHDVS